MLDITLHLVCSYLLTVFAMSFTRNLPLAIVITIFIGLGKEIFLDLDISMMDIAANMVGVMMVASTFRSAARRRSY